MSLTQQMSPDARRRGRRRRGAVLTAIAAVVLVAATVLVTLAVSDSGGGKPTATPATPAPTRFGIPSPSPSTSAAASQAGVMVLPPPARTAANGVPLGFPHTTEGAVSAIVRWESLVVPVNEAREVDVLRTIASQKFIQNDLPLIQEDYREHTLPPGAWLTITVVGVKVLSASSDQVVVAVLDSTEFGTAQGDVHTGFRTASSHLVWSGGDWRVNANDDVPATLGVPASTDPAAVRAAGWEEFQLG